MGYLDQYYSDSQQQQLIQMLKKRGVELLALMRDADKQREEQVGDTVTFINNQNINFSNICYQGCKFCAFSAREGDSHAYRLSPQEIEQQAMQAKAHGVSEICTTAGIDPKADLGSYIDILKILRKQAPGVHIHAFSPFEIDFLSRKEELDYEEVLRQLTGAGMDSLCGTAAEILVPHVRELINPNKLSAEKWIEIIITAHQMNIRSTSTIMYGHVETLDDIAKHLQIIRGIQEETGGFTEFIPLPFIHENTELHKSNIARPGSTGFEDMALYATSRLYLGEEIPNIQTSWVKTGTKFASLTLLAGVNDFGGTLYEENITRSAGGQNGTFLSLDEIVRIIHDADRDAARRDTMYTILERFPRQRADILQEGDNISTYTV
ncbi:MAG: 5-amino-6-(D-ribitylamino)uracil--L-tyrosine 4-hydroxyphenyl transferase CofH [Candidatus Heimdallarchaeota archaeon]|nr:5-amino-6-(D-ribitylamino)uracil--L-tyrosine 4-hydroxyphenyl transferase CofH [Candidatus Heimdallarchaeota archaeon]